MKTGRYSFSQLLNSPEIEQIIVPEIQRDYVWTVKNIEGLLNSIFSKYESKVRGEETLVLLSDFKTSRKMPGDSSLNENHTYTKWNWILVRQEDGSWKHVDHGY